ncbi:MAG: caspase domain-containing protein, partial [Alphaproteobacteria bacterium]
VSCGPIRLRGGGMFSPTDRADGIEVGNWGNSPEPRINGRPVKLPPQEMARSATVLSGGRAVIGTDTHLRLYDGNGRELAAVALPAAAWGVVASGDRRVVVAAVGDGTLHWYSLRDGELLTELLTLFPSGDGRRWIAWTPEGFFAHSESGGAELAGYHVNKGAKGTPEWVEFAQLYQLYYAPELLSKKLARTADAEMKAKLGRIGSTSKVLGDHPAPLLELVEYCPTAEAEGTRGFSRATPAAPAPAPAAGGPGCQAIVAGATRGFARAEKPAAASGAPAAAPVVAAELPPGMNAVKLRFRVTDRQGGIGDVDVVVNGKVVSNTRGFARASQAPAAPASGTAGGGTVTEKTIPLNRGVNRVHVRAYDGGNGVETTSGVLELVVPAPKVQEATNRSGKPRMYILGVAVDKYAPPFTLRFAVKDMSDVIALLKKNKSSAYADVEAVTLTDEQVSLAGLERSIDDLTAKVGPNDTVVLYLSGHGFVDKEAPTAPYYFITQNTDPNNIAKTAFSQGLLKEKLSRFPARNLFLFLDTCHSGTMEMSVFDKASKEFGQVYLLAAASPQEEALDSYKGINGPFAYAVLEGLNGRAATDNVVDNLSLGKFVKKELPRLVAEERPGHRQSANFKAASGEVEDFELARVVK